MPGSACAVGASELHEMMCPEHYQVLNYTGTEQETVLLWELQQGKPNKNSGRHLMSQWQVFTTGDNGTSGV